MRDLGGPDASEAAMRSYGIAIEVAREQAAVMRELRATVSLARIMGAEGLADEAAALLKAHRGLLDGKNDCIDISNARAFRDSL